MVVSSRRRVVDLRRHVDDHGRATEVGAFSGKAERARAPERHADDCRRGGCDRRHSLLERLDVAPRAVVAFVAAVRPPVTREIDRDEGPSECRARRCPRCARSDRRRAAAPAPAPRSPTGDTTAPAQVRHRSIPATPRCPPARATPTPQRSRAAGRTRRSRPRSVCRRPRSRHPRSSRTSPQPSASIMRAATAAGKPPLAIGPQSSMSMRTRHLPCRSIASRYSSQSGCSPLMTR